MAIESMAWSAVLFVVILISGLVVLGVIGASIWLYYWWKKCREFDCIIFRKDGGVTFDKAGIFVDRKTKNKRFYIKNANVGLDPNDVPYKISPGGKKYVFLLQTGLKNFSFMGVDVDAEKCEFSVGEEDVNWGINAYERQKKLFSNSWLMQYMPFIALAFVSIIILILFLNFFKKFDVLKDVALALKDAAAAQSLCTAGTTVI